MPSRDDLDSLLVAGIASHLAAHGLASWDDWENGEPYTSATEWPTYPGPTIPQSPAQLVAITPGSRSRVGATVSITAQVRLRGAVDGEAGILRTRGQEIADVFYPRGRPLVPARGQLGPLRNVGSVQPEGDTLTIPLDGARRWGFTLNLRTRLRWIR